MHETEDESLGERRIRPRWLNIYVVIFLVGLIAFAVAYILLYITKIQPFWPAVMSSVGASLVATSIASWFVLRQPRAWEKIFAAGVTKVFLERDKDIPAAKWHEVIRGAKRECNILGIALHGWVEDTETEPAIKECVAKCVPIKILFLDPESNAAKIRQKEERARRDTIHEIAHAIKRFWEIREDLPDEQRERLDLRIYDNTPSCSIIWTNNQMVVTNYVVSVPNVRSPGCIISDISPSTGLFVKLRKDKRCLFDVYRDNFNTVFKASRELTKELVEKYKKEILKEL